MTKVDQSDASFENNCNIAVNLVHL